MIRFFYNIILLPASIIYFPKILYQYFVEKKYQQSLLKKLGFGFPEVKKGQKRCLWAHAVSLGETKAIIPLLKRFKKENPDFLILLSTATETGHAEGKKGMPEADYHVFLPFDLPWVINPIVKQVDPDIVIICENDLWLNFLAQAKKQRAKIFMVNGKISETSFGRLKKLSSYTSYLFSLFDKLCVQSEAYKQRFLELAVPQEKLTVTGNLKFDSDEKSLSQEEKKAFFEKLGLKESDPIVVAGSTHAPEEELILQAMEKVWHSQPEAKLLLVPRHPERFEEVANLLTKKNIPFNRASGKKDEHAKVVLIDAMGVLKACFQISDISIVAGSFTDKVGGHNIIEPCFYEKPVVFGPYMYTQKDLLALVNEFQAGRQVTIEELPSTLLELLNNPTLARSIGHNGKKLLDAARGSLEKTYTEINKACSK